MAIRSDERSAKRGPPRDFERLGSCRTPVGRPLETTLQQGQPGAKSEREKMARCSLLRRIASRGLASRDEKRQLDSTERRCRQIRSACGANGEAERAKRPSKTPRTVGVHGRKRADLQGGPGRVNNPDVSLSGWFRRQCFPCIRAQLAPQELRSAQAFVCDKPAVFLHSSPR